MAGNGHTIRSTGGKSEQLTCASLLWMETSVIAAIPRSISVGSYYTDITSFLLFPSGGVVLRSVSRDPWALVYILGSHWSLKQTASVFDVSVPYNKISCKRRLLFCGKVLDSFTTNVRRLIPAPQQIPCDFCIIILSVARSRYIPSLLCLSAASVADSFYRWCPPRTRNLIFVHIVFHHWALDVCANIDSVSLELRDDMGLN
jgi:hypothetical protein